jgi:hypothetical protein
MFSGPDPLGDSMTEHELAPLIEQLDRIEAAVVELTRQRQVKDFYTVEEFAALVGLAPFTVGQHCRMGRIKGAKKGSGRGPHKGWAISHEELLRYQREGLLPLVIAGKTR